MALDNKSPLRGFWSPKYSRKPIYKSMKLIIYHALENDGMGNGPVLSL